MTWQQLAIPFLLIVGTAIELLSCVGMLAMDDVYDRLHFVGPAAIVGPVLLAAAVVVKEANSQAGIKAMLIAAIFLLTGPVLTHATGRAARSRAAADWRRQPSEEIERL
jgi:monovalent cation/proton antiporter MnhG/PhaG subunit